jgi:hypothetical protein
MCSERFGRGGRMLLTAIVDILGIKKINAHEDPRIISMGDRE